MKNNSLCKCCRNSKVVEESFHSYTYWLEYDCQYKPDRYVQVRKCWQYSKMNILQKIFRYIRIVLFYKFEIILLIMFFTIIIMIFITKIF